MKRTTIKLKASGFDMDAAVAYPLGVELEADGRGYVGELHIVPPAKRGECHCVVAVVDNEENDLDNQYLYMNMSSSEMTTFANKLLAIAKLHPRNKPYTE